MLRTTIAAVLLFTASIDAQSLRVVGSGDASRMPGACAFPTDVYACTASSCLSPLYACGSNGQSWTPVVVADSSGNVHAGGACPANAPAGSICSNGAVLANATATSMASALSCASASGSSTAYTCPSTVAAACAAGLQVLWTPDVSSGASPTLNVGCGAKAIYTNEGVAANASLFSASVPMILRYDGTEWRAPAIVPSTSGAIGTGTLSVGNTTINPGGTSATDSASLGPELTTSGTCSGTGWTGTYPNYIAPGTTNPLTCTGFTSGSYYQTVTTIGAGGSGAVVIAIGTAQTASGSSGTVTAGLKSNGTSLTYTPASTYTGTIGISAKLITPISIYSYVGKDSTGAISTQFLRQTLGSAHNDFGDNSGAYCTTCSYNTNSGYEGQLNLTTGSNNTNSGYEGQYNLTTGNYNTNSGSAGQLSLTTGSGNTNSGYVGQYNLTTGGSNANSGYEGQYSLTTGGGNTNSGYEGQYSLTTGSNNANSGYEGQFNLTTGSYNTNSGNAGQYNLTTGYNNTSAGYFAGRYIANGSTPNQTSSNSLYNGYETYAKADGDTNENVVGNAAIGAGSNTTVLGNASITDTWMGGSGGSSVGHAKDFSPTSSAPGISGCSSATIVGNDHFGAITAGGTSCNAVLTFSYTASNGWSCQVNNRTHPGVTNLVGQASSTTNSATFAGTTITSDVLNYVCGPY